MGMASVLGRQDVISHLLPLFLKLLRDTVRAGAGAAITAGPGR
jgi:hypothetical protein